MRTSTPARQAQCLIQVGLLLFLAALLVGLVVPYFAIPRLGLSVHLLGLLQGMFFVLVGLLWPRLRLGRGAGWLAFSLLIYGSLAAWSANILAAVWGAGSSMMPMAAGSAVGSPLQEAVIKIALRSAAPSLIVALVLLVWGARGGASGEPGE